MSRSTLSILLIVLAAACGSRAADFDYYLLSLSWSPQYCAQSHRPGEEQCARPYAFVAHGLWPQNEQGYPQDCPVSTRVSEVTIERMLPIMPSRGLVIHEWRAHGACSGLGPEAYFERVTQAYHSVRIPPRYQSPQDALSVSSAELKQDFASVNRLPAGALTLECSGHYLQEVRVCLDRSLSPRACGHDARDHCGDSVVLRPVR